MPKLLRTQLLKTIQHPPKVIHRSYIVSVKKVTAFTINDVELGKIELPISKSYPDVFKKLTGNKSILPMSEE